MNRSLWILVANRSDAKVFKYTKGARVPLKLVREVHHPQGRSQGRDLDSDRPGRTFSPRSTHIKHGLDKAESARDHATEGFAKHLAQLLHQERATDQFDQLILVAEPGFLGSLKAELDQPTLARVAGTVHADLAWLDDGQIYEHVQPAIMQVLHKVA